MKTGGTQPSQKHHYYILLIRVYKEGEGDRREGGKGRQVLKAKGKDGREGERRNRI